MRDPLVLRYATWEPRWITESRPLARQFERQVRSLLRLGYHASTFGQVLSAPTHDRSLAVTFDGSCGEAVHVAAPVLRRLGLSATLFVIPEDLEDGGAQLHAGSEGGEAGTFPERRARWGDVRKLVHAGWEIGLHLHTVPQSHTDPAALVAALAASRDAIEASADCSCRSIAYPNASGAVDERLVGSAARAGFQAGAAIWRPTAGSPRTSTRLRWRRLAVDARDPLPLFMAKAAAAVLASSGKNAAQPDPMESQRHVDHVGDPRVAVIVPCFNDGPLACEAVASINEREPIELVVVDDASTAPETARALESLESDGVRVAHHRTNQGLSAARRTGLAATSARYVFPLDADDLLVPESLSRLADRLDAEPSAVAAWGDEVEFGSRHRRQSVPVRLDPFRIAYRNQYPVSSMFRRDVLDDIGGWQDVGGAVGYEDWNLWMTLAERGHLAVHAGPGTVAIRRRLHGRRMLTDAIDRHRTLYFELRRTHPQLFADVARHRQRSSLPRSMKFLYPILFGSRPQLGLRDGVSEMTARLSRPLRRSGV